MAFILLFRQTPMAQANKLLNDIVFAIISVVLFLIYIFRNYNIGTDYRLYHSFFLVSPEQLNLWGIEKGYIFINTISQESNNFILVSVIIYLLYFFGLYYLSRTFKFDKLIFLSLFVITYMYYYPFNGMRQMGAMGIIAFGYSFYIRNREKRILKYVYLLIAIFIASLIHSSAYICILYLVFERINLKKTYVIVCAILSLVLIQSSLATKISTFLIGLSPTYTAKYLTNNSIDYFTNTSPIGLLLVILIIIQYLFLYFYVDKVNLDEVSINEKIIINGYLLLLVLYSCTSVLLYRISWYFYAFQLFFACMVFMTNNKKISVLYKTLFFIFLLIFYLYELLYINNGQIVPYQLLS